MGPVAPKGRAPFELIVAVQIYAVAVLVNLFVEVGQRRHPGERVIAQVLAPATRGAGFPRRCGTEDLTVVDVAVHVQHRDKVNLTGIHEVGDELFRIVLIHAEVAGAAVGTVAVGVLVFCSKGKTIAVVIELTVTVGVAPGVFVHQAVPIVVVADVLVGERDDLKLHHRHLVGHPLASVVVAHDHDIVAVSVVAVVAHKGVVFAALDILCDFHPRRGIAVVPTFVGIGRDFLASSVGAPVHAVVELENVRVVLSEAHHSGFHRLVGVVLLELKNLIVGGCPRENHVDVIL